MHLWPLCSEMSGCPVGSQVLGYASLANAVKPEQGPQLSVLLGNPASSDLHLGGGLDAPTLEIADALLELVDVLLLPCSGAPLVIPYPGKVSVSLLDQAWINGVWLFGALMGIIKRWWGHSQKTWWTCFGGE